MKELELKLIEMAGLSQCEAVEIIDFLLKMQGKIEECKDHLKIKFIEVGLSEQQANETIELLLTLRDKI